jgi:hypothetical protein
MVEVMAEDMVEVMAEGLDRAFWRSLRERLERELS